MPNFHLKVAAIDAVPVALWFVIRYAVWCPKECLPRCIGAGGDTDTTASMAGAILGALYGARAAESSLSIDGEDGSLASK